MWKPDAAPTRANVMKRLDAAEDALVSAQQMLERMGSKEKPVINSVVASADWIGHARLLMQKRKGRRSK
jgi:hypothetical protein